MKAINKIILASLILLLASTLTLTQGGSLQRFNIYLGNNKVVEVITKEENLVDEVLPILNEKEDFQLIDLIEWVCANHKEEKIIEEDLVTMGSNRVKFTDQELILIIKNMGIEDVEVVEDINSILPTLAK